MEEESFIIYIILFLSLYIFYALFSGTETAFFSLSEFDKQNLHKKATKSAFRVLNLLTNSKALLISIKFPLIILQAALFCLSIPFSNLTANYLGISFGLTLTLVVGLNILIVFVINSLWSNLIMLKYNQGFAEFVSYPLKFIYQITSPLSNAIAKLLTYLSIKFNVAQKSSYLANNKFITMVENGNEVSNLEDSERDMIYSIFEFGDTEVHEIMVPRIDMVCVDESVELEELSKLIQEKGHSRIPLMRESIDNILGVVHVKDLLHLVNKKDEKIDLNDLARPAYFVPENKKLHNLLKEFQQEKSHMAIVVDEYGGTAGLVTLEDVIEEIVGDIQDEYDQEAPLFRKLDDSTFMVDAKIDLHDLNEFLELDLPTEGEYESLGGFILTLTGYVPQEKEEVRYDSYKFVVEKIDRNRIIQIKISKNKTKLENEPDSSNEFEQ